MFEAWMAPEKLAAVLLPEGAWRPFPAREERGRWEALPRTVKEELMTWGEEALAGYPQVTATQFLAFVRTGERACFEKPYFERRRRLMGAVLAECVCNDGRFVDAVIDGIWCVCEESSWVLSAHNGSMHEGMRPSRERPLPDVRNPYIDLFAAQTAATLCYTLYLLKDKLDAVSPLIGRRVRLELEKRIFLPFLTRDDFWWMGMTRKDLNNWTPWIVSNVLDSMLLEMEDRDRLSEGVVRALAMLERYLAVMPADGGCDEGSAYWNMAGGSLLDCLESLYSATEGKLCFYKEPLIQNIGMFPLHAHIAGPYFWNFADCDAKPPLNGERVSRYGERIGHRGLQSLGVALCAQETGIKPKDTPQMNRVLLALFSNIPTQETAEDSADVYVELPDLQVFAWRKNGLYVAIKGGHNAENHNHNDVGSFLLYADGEPHIVDAGNLVYTAKTFGEERYTLWNTRSINHNLPLIGTVEQQNGPAFAAREVVAQENAVSMELAGAYPAQAQIRIFQRTMEVLQNGVTVNDQLELESPQPVTWVLLLAQEPNSVPGGLDFGKLCLHTEPPIAPQVEPIPMTDERMKKSYEGFLWRVTFTAAPACKQQFRMKITRS